MPCRTLLLFAVLLAGCGFGADKSVETGSAEPLVLQDADLPGFLVASSAGDRVRWTARYRRSGATATGPVAIESTVEISDSSEDAGRRLSEKRERLDGKLDWQPIGEPGLGDESFASTIVRGDSRTYEVFWREGNVAAQLSMSGSDGTLAFADVLALAEKQERRISDASYGSTQRTFGGLVVARLPFEPTALIAVPAHLAPAKRTTNRPAELAVTDFLVVPVETVTRSLGLKPRPLMLSGCMLMTVSVAREAGAGEIVRGAVGAAACSCAAPPMPTVINTTSRPISNTTLRV